MQIFVKMFDDRFVVESPGGFLPPTNSSNIYSSHNPRNPRLIQALYYFDWVKCAHEGTRRMRDTTSEAELPAPEFAQREVAGHQVEVTLRNNGKRFKANEVRLQLHALAYNLANFLRTLVLPAAIADWSLTSLRDRMIKIGAKAVRHARSITLQLAEVAVPRDLWAQMLATISGLEAKAQAP